MLQIVYLETNLHSVRELDPYFQRHTVTFFPNNAVIRADVMKMLKKKQ